RSQVGAKRRLSLFVPPPPDKLHLVTRIGRPADKRVFLPRFRVATICRAASRKHGNDRQHSVSVLGAVRRSARTQHPALGFSLGFRLGGWISTIQGRSRPARNAA